MVFEREWNTIINRWYHFSSNSKNTNLPLIQKCSKWIIHSKDNLYLTYSKILVPFAILRRFVTWIVDTLIASCDGCHAWGRWCLLNPEHLVVVLARPISHTSIRYIDFVEISMFHWIFLLFILLILMGVELPLHTVITLSYNDITCFLESSSV